MAKEVIEGCSDAVLEGFLVKTRPLLVHLLPEPDDENVVTVAGIVSNNYNYIIYKLYLYIKESIYL